MQIIKVLGVGKNGIYKWFDFRNITLKQAQLAVAYQGYEPLLCRKYRRNQMSFKYLINREISETFALSNLINNYPVSSQ